MVKRSRRPSPLRSAGSASAVRTAGDGVNDRRQEAAAGVRKDDGNARRPERHHHIRAVVAVEVGERGQSGHAGEDGFGGAEVRLAVVAPEHQIVPDDDGEILVAVAIDVHRGQRSPERDRETGHERQRAGPVVREQPEADRIHRRVAFAGRNHVGMRIPVEVRDDVHPGRRRRRESRRRESTGTIVQEHVDTAGVDLVGGDGVQLAVVIHVDEAYHGHRSRRSPHKAWGPRTSRRCRTRAGWWSVRCPSCCQGPGPAAPR